MPRRPSTWEDPVVLEAALEGLALQKQRIEAQMSDIRAQLGRPSRHKSASAPTAAPAKRNLSPAARKRIATAQKKRWAEYRKSNGGAK
jgi:hypothetical protein